MTPISSNARRLRSVWWALHRWVALVLCILLVPISISGALLVWHDALDAFLHPARYAVTGDSTTGAATYLANAKQALPPGFVAMTVRFPLGDGPVTVLARGEEGPRGKS